jgi:hypothetical protein
MSKRDDPAASASAGGAAAADVDLRDQAALVRAVDELLARALRARARASETAPRFAPPRCATSIEPVEPVRGVVLSAWTGRTLLEVTAPSLDDDDVRAATTRLSDMIAREGVVRQRGAGGGAGGEGDGAGGARIERGEALERDFIVAEVEPANGASLDARLERAVSVKDRIHARRAWKNAVARATHVRTQGCLGPTRRPYRTSSAPSRRRRRHGRHRQRHRSQRRPARR